MKKKILAAFVCAAAVLSLEGCASNENTSALMNIASNAANQTSKPTSSATTSKSGTTSSAESPAAVSSAAVSSANSSAPAESAPAESTPAVGSGIDWDNVPYADELDFLCEDYDPSNFNFKDQWDELYAGGVVIYEYTGNDKLIKIPETIDGKPVVGIATNNLLLGVFRNLSDTGIKIPKKLGFIYGGFSYCNNLTVDFPDYEAGTGEVYRSLNKYSFNSCNNLKLNMEPNSVGTSSAERYFPVFNGCTFNGAVVMPDSLIGVSEYVFGDDLVFNPEHSPEAIIYKGKTYDRQHLGAFFDKVNESKFDESGMKIEDGVLKDVSRATEGTLTVPDNVTSIGKNAFYQCIDITEVIIPDAVTNIHDEAFGIIVYDGTIGGGFNANVTYKGKTYKPNQLGNLIKAING